MKDAYIQWCKDEGLMSLPVTAFKNGLTELGFKERKSGSKRFWEGISLVDPLSARFEEPPLW